MSSHNSAQPFPTTRCPDCERMIPSYNLMIHQATACEAARSNLSCEPEARPTLVRSDTVRTASLTASEMDVDPTDADSDPPHDPASLSVAPMPSATRAIEISQDSDEDSIPSASGLRRRNPSRDPASNAAMEVITIDDDETPQTEEDVTSWHCPRCTLVNQRNATSCAACQYQHDRPADPSRRERLVDSPLEENAASSPVLNGALLGTLLFGAGALVTGNSLASGMFEGAVTGAVGGAMVDSVLSSPLSRSPERTAMATRARRSQRRRDQARRAPPPQQQPLPEEVRRGPRPRPRASVRVVRSNGRTTVTASNRRGSASVPRPGHEDSLMALLMGLASAEAALGGEATGPPNVDGMSYEQLLGQFGDGSENMGASEAMIAALPSSRIQDVEKELPPNARECLICLEEFENGDNRKTLPCLHGFHEACVNKWLQQNGSCPICKHKVSST